MTQHDLFERLHLAVSAAREAGQITRRYFLQGNYEIELKADSSPVTVADREAELHLRERIEGAFPSDGILGEEFPEKPGEGGFRWILDPIDGTKTFVSGVPFYGTMIGVEYEEKSVIGVVEMPALDECIYAAVGEGAWWRLGDAQPRRAKVSNCDSLDDAVFLTTDVKAFAKLGRSSAYEKLQAATRMTRTWGDCYGYLLVATARAEVMVDPLMNVWDAAALQPIMEEAGGTFTDWRGEPTIHHEEGIATNSKLLDRVIAITGGC